MPRGRFLLLATLGVAALAATGIATAGRLREQSTQQTQATFAAATVSKAKTKTCAGADGTYRETTATYTGASTSSDARLNGPIAIRAHSVVDTTSGLGWVQGTFRVRGTSGGAHGTLVGAVSGGNLAGSLVGVAGGPAGKLVATIGAGFDDTAGFSAGAIGTGSVSPAAVVFTRGACTKPPRTRSVWRAALAFHSSAQVRAHGLFTLDVTRDSSGTITGANAVFYVNYRSNSALTLNGLTLNAASGGAVVLDSGLGTVIDSDGSGNVTEVVTGVSGATAQAILSHPRTNVVVLDTSAGAITAAVHGFGRGH